MASQMVDARVLRTTIEISAKGAGNDMAVFTASGKAIEFAGFRRAYVEGSDDPAAELEEQETILPQCSVGDRIDRDGTAVTLLGAESKRHETTPPARFTEASLIKELERLGIGRPSTYAPTIATIVRRGYVFRQSKALDAQLHRVRRHEAAARPLRRLRRNRFHRRDGGRPRRDLARRARVVGVPEAVLLRRQEAPRAADRRRARRREGRLPGARPGQGRRQRRSGPRARRPLRPVRAAGRGRSRAAPRRCPRMWRRPI